MKQGTLDLGLFLEPFNPSGYASVSMKTKERWGVLIHKDAPLASQNEIRPGDLVGTLVVTIHVNTPAHTELIRWSGKFAEKMDFSTNYNILHNAVIVAREQKGAVICLQQDCHYNDMKFLPLKPELSVGSFLAWNEGQKYAKATEAFIHFVKEALETK